LPAPGRRWGVIAVILVAGIALWAGCGGSRSDLPITVAIRTNPERGGVVSINGVVRGVTPLTVTDLAPGQALVEVEQEGFKHAWQVVVIENKVEPQEFLFEMEPRVGYLSVDSTPQRAKVILDGEKVLGVTPLTKAPVPIGNHRYLISAEGYDPIEQELRVEEDFQYQKNHLLTPRGALLEVYSVPTGANIWVDNQLMEARTPTKITLKPGTYTITVHTKGYIQSDQVVQLQPNETRSIEVQMTPGAVPPGMALIPAGEFLMGEDGSSPDEAPQRKVFVEAFYIDKYEVTNEQFKAVFPSFQYGQGKGSHPVTGITYNEAVAFASAVGKRLPTEMEWEKAARGTDEREYPWGNVFQASACNVEGGPNARTFEVGHFRAGVSPYGCMDMAGNALEWTSSWYQAYPGNQVIQKEYGQLFRVLRGGSFRTKAFDARCARRLFDTMDARREDYGLRCALDVKAEAPSGR